MPEKISLALGVGKKAPKPTNGVKRSHASLREDEDEQHDEGRAQTVSHFDKLAGGAIDEANKKIEQGPLTIAPQANRNWRDASKRRKQRHALPSEAQQSVSEDAIKALEASKPGYGLNVTKRESDGEEPTINGRDIQAEAEASGQLVPPEPNGENSVQTKTDDELAMDALLGNKTESGLVLPAVSEEQAFEQDVQEAPDMATLDDYARVPVEQFGAALLRGMGWKEGEGIGSQRGKKVEKTKVLERRPALLGIGAKEEAAVAQEMGSWGKAAKRGGEVKVYNPVLIKDKNTGKLYTEEELQKKKENAEREKYEEEFDRKEREREKRIRREDGEDRDGQRNGDRRPRRDENEDPRDRGHDRKHRRDDKDRRRRDDDSDEEYYRRKEKERRRRERERDSSDHDRERSRRHDGDRDWRKDRDRDHRR